MRSSCYWLLTHKRHVWILVSCWTKQPSCLKTSTPWLSISWKQETIRLRLNKRKPKQSRPGLHRGRTTRGCFIILPRVAPQSLRDSDPFSEIQSPVTGYHVAVIHIFNSLIDLNMNVEFIECKVRLTHLRLELKLCKLPPRSCYKVQMLAGKSRRSCYRVQMRVFKSRRSLHTEFKCEHWIVVGRCMLCKPPPGISRYIFCELPFYFHLP